MYYATLRFAVSDYATKHSRGTRQFPRPSPLPRRRGSARLGRAVGTTCACASAYGRRDAPSPVGLCLLCLDLSVSCVRDACRLRAGVFHAQRRSRHFVFCTHVAALLIRPRKVTQMYIYPRRYFYLFFFFVVIFFFALVESAIDNRPPSNIGRACVTTKEAKRKIITASER